MSKTTAEEVAAAMAKINSSDKAAWVNTRAGEDRLTGNMVTLTRCKRRPLFLAILEVLYT